MRIRSTLTALLAAGALTLTGCSGDATDATDADSEQNSAAQEAPKDEPEPPADRSDDESANESAGDDDSKAGSGGSGKAETSKTPETLTFQSTTIEGKKFDGATLAGKPTVMWFWAPWCPKCRAAAPYIKDSAQKFGDEVNIVGVAGLGEVDAMRQFVDDYDLSNVPHLADENDPLWTKFEVEVQHTYVILDADGTEVHNGGLDESGLTDKLTELTS